MHIAEKSRGSPLKKGSKKTDKEGEKEMADKRRGDKPPLGTKAPKKTHPIHDLVSIRSNYLRLVAKCK